MKRRSRRIDHAALVLLLGALSGCPSPPVPPDLSAPAGPDLAASPPDMPGALADQPAGADLAGADIRAGVDLAARPDLFAAPDLTSPLDLSASADLTPLPDLAPRDLGPADLPIADAAGPVPLPAEMWAVGAGGTTHHFDGTAWSVVPTGTAFDLQTIYIAGPGDAWAGGNGLLHWDGVRWISVPRGTTGVLWYMHGSGPRDIWAATWGAGSGSDLVHYDGTGWTRYTGASPGDIHGLWARGPGDFDLITAAARFRWDGTQWKKISGIWHPGDAFHTLWGAEGQVYSCYSTSFWGDRDTCYAPVSFAAWGGWIDYVGALRLDNIWLGYREAGSNRRLARFDGRAWRTQPVTAYPYVLQPTGPNDAFGLLPTGVARWDGTSWQLVRPGSFSDLRIRLR